MVPIRAIVVLVLMLATALAGCARGEVYQGGCAMVKPEGQAGAVSIHKADFEAVRTIITERWADGTERISDGPLSKADHHLCERYEHLPAQIHIQIVDAERGQLASGTWPLEGCPEGHTWFDLQVDYGAGRLDEDVFVCGVDEPPWLRPGPPVT